MTRAEQRDPPKLYNPMSPTELAAYAHGFPWAAFLHGAGLESKTRVILAQKTAFPKIAKIFADTPIETLKAWLAFTVADTAAPYLSSSFASAHFHFHDAVLLGIQEQPLRWKLGVRAVSGGDCFAGGPRDCFGTLNWAVGQMYTARYFPPETKKSIEAMVANITQTYRRRLEHLDWMSDTTRAEALHKLDTYIVKVGYPNRPRDYSGVVIKDDDPDWQRAARGGGRLGFLPRAQRRSGRQERLGDDAADGGCLQRQPARHRVPPPRFSSLRGSMQMPTPR